MASPSPAPRPRLPWWTLWPALTASAVFLTLVGIGARATLSYNHGKLTYPIDDAYGHLAIAKNLVRHGVWAFSYLDGFSSAASSLVWPLLVAGCFAVFGQHDYLPFILAIVSAVALLCYTAAFLRRLQVPGWLNLLVLVVATYLTPLPGVTATGMEHCLQMLLDLAFISLAVRVLAGEAPVAGRAARLELPVLACLMVATRYEGLFIIAVVGLLFLCRGWWRSAVIFGTAAAVVPTLYGLYSLSKGWYFLPNSLLLKGNTAPLSFSFDGLVAYLSKGYDHLLENPHILFLGLAMIAAFVTSLRRHGTLWCVPALLLAVTLGVTALHLQYAGFGWFYRYEAYLVFLGVVSLGVCVADAGLPAFSPQAPAARTRSALIYGAALALAAAAFGVPLIKRANESIRLLPRACHNIYEQQYQMALFLRRFYAGQGVAANDIGAIDYYGNIRLFDLFGLADINVLRAVRAGDYDHREVEAGIKNHDVRVIAVYDEWAVNWGGHPVDWVPVGCWGIGDNVICGGSVVSFYAPNADLVPELTHALQAFAPALPPDVSQSGPYRGERPSQAEIGAYNPENDGEGDFYWVNHAVQFFLYPVDNPASPGSGAVQEQEGVLRVNLLPTEGCTAVDLYVNGQREGTREFPAGEPREWLTWSLPARARPGQNLVRLIGHGEATQPPGDGRRLLFGMRPPQWTLAASAPEPGTGPR